MSSMKSIRNSVNCCSRTVDVPGDIFFVECCLSDLRRARISLRRFNIISA